MRQGGIVSTDLCKIYQNPPLNWLQHSVLGARVGNVTWNISVCAAGLAVNINSCREGQVLVNSSTDHASLERYLLQVDKSVMVTVNANDGKNTSNSIEPIMINAKEMKQLNLKRISVFIKHAQSPK